MPPSNLKSRKDELAAGDCTAEFERLIKKTPAGNFVLRLFVTGTTPRSARAIANIRALCDENLAGRYDLEVIDIYQQPMQASGEQIIAAPTLLKKLPAPARRMVGDFSNRAGMLLALGVRSRKPGTKSGVRTQWLEL